MIIITVKLQIVKKNRKKRRICKASFFINACGYRARFAQEAVC